MANLVDRAISVFSPNAALSRAEARQQLERLATKRPQLDRARREALDRLVTIARGFEGAKQDRLTTAWQPGSQSIDSQILTDGRVLRERARDLVQNNGFGKGAMNAIIANCVGTGIKPMPKLTDRRQRKLWRDAWRHWAEKEADITGHQHFYEMQALALKECVAGGEVLLRYIWLSPQEMSRRGRRTPFALQLIEAERIADSEQFYGVPTNGENGHQIRNGVEVDSYGSPVAYWLLPTHPNDITTGYQKPERHAASMFRHVFVRERIGQYRGVTWLAAAIQWLYKLGVYTDNEMMSSALSACVMLLVKTLDGNSDGNDFGVLTDGESTDSAGNKLDHMAPGLVHHLAVGEDIESFNPGRPNAQSEPWITLILRSIGVAMDLGYEAISRDHSKTNFSGQRGEELENRRRYRQVNAFAKWRYLAPVYEHWVRANVLVGTDGFPSADEFTANMDAYQEAEWIGDGREWIDPVKEQQANQGAVDANQTTLSAVVAESGGDWTDVLEQRAAELTYIRELEQQYGIDFTPDSALVNQGAQAAAEQTKGAAQDGD